MSEERKVSVDEARAALAAIGPNEDGRYEYANRQPPAGYITLRDVYRVADSHPSWLRTLISSDGLDKWNVEGAPAVIKNLRGVWAIRIDALEAYEMVKRTPGEGTGAGAGYQYEPQVLKAVKRAKTAVAEYKEALAISDTTVADMDKLVEHLKGLWESGAIGKEASSEVDEVETKAEAAPGADEGDEDFEFDFEDVD